MAEKRRRDKETQERVHARERAASEGSRQSFIQSRVCEPCLCDALSIAGMSAASGAAYTPCCPPTAIDHCAVARLPHPHLVVTRGTGLEVYALHQQTTAAAGGTARRSCIRAPLNFHQYPVPGSIASSICLRRRNLVATSRRDCLFPNVAMLSRSVALPQRSTTALLGRDACGSA